MRIELCRRPWIDQKNLRSRLREFSGMLDKIVYLPLTVRALVSGVASKDYEDYLALLQEIVEFDRHPFGGVKDEIRCSLSNIRRCGLCIHTGYCDNENKN